jgi:hypothetical protein
VDSNSALTRPYPPAWVDSGPTRGRSSVDRASASGAEGRRFEPSRPRQAAFSARSLPELGRIRRHTIMSLHARWVQEVPSAEGLQADIILVEPNGDEHPVRCLVRPDEESKSAARAPSSNTSAPATAPQRSSRLRADSSIRTLVKARVSEFDRLFASRFIVDIPVTQEHLGARR